MEELEERSWFTIDERLNIHQIRMKLCLEELNGELTDDDCQTFEKYKAEEERAIYLLKCKKKKMLERPTFLLLIANANNKIVKNFSTYIETADEAKYFSKGTIKKILIDNKVNLVLGCYTGVIVRKSFYDKMSDIDRLDVCKVINDKAYVTSRDITVTNEGMSII